MRTSKFTEEQIARALHQHEADSTAGPIGRKLENSDTTFCRPELREEDHDASSPRPQLPTTTALSVRGLAAVQRVVPGSVARTVPAPVAPRRGGQRPPVDHVTRPTSDTRTERLTVKQARDPAAGALPAWGGQRLPVSRMVATAREPQVVVVVRTLKDREVRPRSATGALPVASAATGIPHHRGETYHE
jgi:hypothetical protein